ncbi:MAG: SGNH/GDSL hydrolase family protein [Thermoguttaceae bacterium]|nr:SGNH/GDSL hydrolase family protein [Thermoguttaceae bacterium]
MYEEYSNALRKFCEEQGDLFIDPNPYIKSILDVYPHSRYMLDYVHPNATDGVNLYSEAVLSY